jgi:hypothetical protein
MTFQYVHAIKAKATAKAGDSSASPSAGTCSVSVTRAGTANASCP